jgi:hypothetical protein
MRRQFHFAALVAAVYLSAFSPLAKAQQLDVIQFSSAYYSVIENAGTVAIELQRTGSMRDYASLHVRTELHANQYGRQADTNDFRPFSGAVEFAPGQRNLTVILEIFNDSSVEGWEWFDVVIAEPDPFCCQLGLMTRVNIAIPGQRFWRAVRRSPVLCG